MNSSATPDEMPRDPAARSAETTASAGSGTPIVDYRPCHTPDEKAAAASETFPSSGSGGDSLHGHGEGIELPAPTTWPMFLALGLSLMAFGLVTTWAVSAAGTVIFFIGLFGWIVELQPGRGHYHVPLVPADQRAQPIEVKPVSIQHLKPGSFGHRMQVPEKVHPYSAGIKGGIYGGIAMAFIAAAYGFFSGKGVFFTVNLMAAIVLPELSGETYKELLHFQAWPFVVGITIHAFVSLLMGLLYGLMLPMMPRHPIILGGVIGPLLWTGFLHSFMGVLDPTLLDMMDMWDWYSFVLAQFAFGFVAGLTVVRSQRVYSNELWQSGQW